jgi:UDP-arabinose 4-epimerase
MTTVLVTGGAGYVGSHACRALASAGYEPVTYDNLSRGFAHAVRWGPLEQGDILDQLRLEAVCRRYRPVAVIHFAAFAYVGESMRDPALYWHNNVRGSLALLQAMRAVSLRRLVFSSSCAVYGEPDSTPITESVPLAPVNPYGASKLAVERMLADSDPGWGLRSVSLRYFNAAGADPDGEIGENHDPETHLIPLVLEAARNPVNPVTVFGADYATEDGSCVRDYVHVSDLARAHILALDLLLQGGETLACNLGTGRGHSVLEVIEATRRVTGLEPAFRHGRRRPGDPAILVSDAGKAGRLLGWHPAYSRLDDMIAHAWGWMNRPR